MIQIFDPHNGDAEDDAVHQKRRRGKLLGIYI